MRAKRFGVKIARKRGESDERIGREDCVRKEVERGYFLQIFNNCNWEPTPYQGRTKEGLKRGFNDLIFKC